MPLGKTLKSIMNVLYGGTHDEVINMLSAAKYIDNYPIKGNPILIHTGFVFKIHTGTNFEVLYNNDNNSLVFQPHGPIRLPILTGLIVQSKRGTYFDFYSTKYIVARIEEDDGTEFWLETNGAEIFANNYDHQFEISSNSEIIAKFPLSRIYDRSIYSGRSEFRKYGSIEDADPDELRFK